MGKSNKFKGFVQNTSFAIISTTIWVVIACTCLMVLSFFLNNISKHEGDWISFSGSFIGAIISVLGVYWQVNKQLKEQKRDQKILESKNMLIACNKIQTDINLEYERLYNLINQSYEFTDKYGENVKGLKGIDMEELEKDSQCLKRDILNNMFLTFLIKEYLDTDLYIEYESNFNNVKETQDDLKNFFYDNRFIKVLQHNRTRNDYRCRLKNSEIVFKQFIVSTDNLIKKQYERIK